MRHFPIFLDLKGRRVAVFGGGAAALNKVRLLQSAGARVVVLADDLGGQLAALAARGLVDHEKPRGAPDLSPFALVVSAAGDPTDTDVAAQARALNVPVNVVDRPDLCSFITPSIVDRGEVVVAISTGGHAPVLARRLRERLEALLPPGIGHLAALIGRSRVRVAAKLASIADRRRFWEGVVDGPVGAAALSGRSDAGKLLDREIEGLPSGCPAGGAVHIVGAGPGDPDLLTLKALRAIQDADVILYDELVTPDILDRARRDAERVFVGRRAGAPGMPQDEINRRLITEARTGSRVVRLKGGDPFVFGRAGEEAEAVRDAGLPVVVVPGVTAVLGIAAEAQIPLTRRGEASALAVVTATREESGIAMDWSRYAGADQTVAVYMGRREAAAVASGLIQAGRPPDTAAAVVSNGTRSDRRAFVGSLRDLAALAAQAGEAPTLIVIGEVVRRSALWAEAAAVQPLAAE